MKKRDEAADVELLAREWERLAEECGPLILELDPMHAWVLLSAIQLALRHPLFDGPSAELAEDTGWTIQRLFADVSPELGELAALGFDPAYDRIYDETEQTND